MRFLKRFKNRVAKNNRDPIKRNNAIIFVDVDGTCSPTQIQPNDDYFTSDWNGSHWFPSRLRKLLHSLDADKIWLTTWGKDAEETFLMGWETVDEKYFDFGWKPVALFNHVKEHGYKKAVWIDDEINDDWLLEVGRLQIENNFFFKLYPIIPDSSKGLTEEHFDIIENELRKP